MEYISLFSGIGGLESRTMHPRLFCEIDRTCWPVLKKKFPDSDLWPDITTLDPPKVDVVASGWPCQDISVAGKQSGLAGARSGLFYQMIRVSKSSCAHTVAAENVPNLLRLHNGEIFRAIESAFSSSLQNTKRLRCPFIGRY